MAGVVSLQVLYFYFLDLGLSGLNTRAAQLLRTVRHSRARQWVILQPVLDHFVEYATTFKSAKEIEIIREQLLHFGISVLDISEAQIVWEGEISELDEDACYRLEGLYAQHNGLPVLAVMPELLHGKHDISIDIWSQEDLERYQALHDMERGSGDNEEDVRSGGESAYAYPTSESLAFHSNPNLHTFTDRLLSWLFVSLIPFLLPLLQQNADQIDSNATVSKKPHPSTESISEQNNDAPSDEPPESFSAPIRRPKPDGSGSGGDAMQRNQNEPTEGNGPPSAHSPTQIADSLSSSTVDTELIDQDVEANQHGYARTRNAEEPPISRTDAQVSDLQDENPAAPVSLKLRQDETEQPITSNQPEQPKRPNQPRQLPKPLPQLEQPGADSPIGETPNAPSPEPMIPDNGIAEKPRPDTIPDTPPSTVTHAPDDGYVSNAPPAIIASGSDPSTLQEYDNNFEEKTDSPLPDLDLEPELPGKPDLQPNCFDGLGGRQIIQIRAEDRKVIISNFGGVGTGINPAQQIIDEVDTLQFIGDGVFTVQNMFLFQEGDDLVIRFEGAETEVILQNFQMENLDNFAHQRNASLELANVLFGEQAHFQDSFDVLDANSQLKQVLNPDRVTFLNDQDNWVSGQENSDDIINGQGGKDTLIGLSGDDVLRGGFDDDTLIGGSGNNILLGGEGSNLFVLSLNGFSQVTDFSPKKDFVGLPFNATLDQVQIHQGCGLYSNDTWIKVNGVERLLLKNVQADLLTKDRFTLTSFEL